MVFKQKFFKHMKHTSDHWRKSLELLPHPEGGYFKEVHRSEHSVKKDSLPPSFSGDRNISTSIYYMLEGNDTSKFHRILSDELWHFYDGDTLLIYEFENDGKMKIHRLGLDTESGDLPQAVIKAGNWFGAKLLNPETYCLAGCTVSPGFDFNDFEMADRSELIKRYPDHFEIINLLT